MARVSEWEQTLARELDRFLPKPMASHPPGSRFALFHWDDILSGEFFDSATLDALATPATPASSTVAAAGGSGAGWSRWAFDLGRSVFPIDDLGEIDELAGAPAAELRATARKSKGSRVVYGHELARVLRTHGIAPTDLAGDPSLFMPVHVRVVTDGSLFDALRAATFTMDRAGLDAVDPAARVDPAWRETLDAVADPALRRHLAMLFLDAGSARCYGAGYRGATWPCDSEPVRFEAAELVAGWEFGEGQAWSAVVRLKRS